MRMSFYFSISEASLLLREATGCIAPTDDTTDWFIWLATDAPCRKRIRLRMRFITSSFLSCGSPSEGQSVWLIDF